MQKMGLLIVYAFSGRLGCTGGPYSILTNNPHRTRVEMIQRSAATRAALAKQCSQSRQQNTKLAATRHGVESRIAESGDDWLRSKGKGKGFRLEDEGKAT